MIAEARSEASKSDQFRNFLGLVRPAKRNAAKHVHQLLSGRSRSRSCPSPPFVRIIRVAASVSIKPGETVRTRMPFGLTSFDERLAVIGQRGFRGRIGQGGVVKRQRPLDRGDMNDDARAPLDH